MLSLQGWDKTYCLQFVEKDFDEIHFFGDKTFPVRCSSCIAVAPSISQQLQRIAGRIATPLLAAVCPVHCTKWPRQLQDWQLLHSISSKQ